MYNTFYGFKENPFDITPNSKFLFWSQKHQTAFRHLLYGVESRKGLVLLTGEVGTGKTTLLNALIEFFKAPESKSKIIYLAYSKFSVDDLFRYIFSELKLTVSNQSKSDYWIMLKEFLTECNKREEKTLLILDEAQNYAIDVLEEIRLLLNLETPEGKLIQIILAGQPQLLKNIDRPELYQLKQRIGISYNLYPLNGDETKLYIQKRLDVVGTKDSSIFSQNAVNEIYVYSQGIPRIINILCDNALLFGYAVKRNQIDEDIIEQVAKNMDLEKSELNNTKIYKSFIEDPIESESMRVEDDKYERHYRYRQFSGESLRDKRSGFRENFNYRSREEEKSKKRFILFAQITIIPSIILLAVLFIREDFISRTGESIKRILYNAYYSYKEYANVNTSKSEKNISDISNQQETEQKNQDLINRTPAASSFPTLSPGLENERKRENPIQSLGTAEDGNKKIVIVSMGDTFRDIVINRYGEYNKTIIDLVLKANPEIKDTNTILIGQPIILPNI